MEPPAKELVASIAPGLQLRRGTERDSRQEIDWIPIVAWVLDEDRFVGLASEGYWLVEGPHGLHLVNRLKDHLFLFRMMERPMQEIVRAIRANPTLDECADRVIGAFPFVEIIRAAFKNRRAHWVEYAYGWFEALPLEARASLTDELEELRVDRGSGQKLRHRAQKELARIRRESGQSRPCVAKDE